MSLDDWIDELGGQLRRADHRRTAAPRVTRRAAALIVLAAAVTVVVVIAVSWTKEREIPAHSPTPTVIPQVPADDVVERAYMGVACAKANVIACDRVGLAVWLRDSARAVEAEIAGRSFPLDDREWSAQAQDGVRRTFAGFLQPAGLTSPGPLQVETDRSGRWDGRTPVNARITLIVTHVSGKRVQTQIRVALAAGWG